MAPRIIGQEIETSRDLLDRIAFIKGNEFARAALDIAWWVLDAKRRGVPLHVALGGTGDHVRVGADFGVQDSFDTLLGKIQGAIDAGFPRIKLKFRPGWDLKMVEAVRTTFPRFTFHIDCNAAYTLADLDALPDAGPLRAGHDRAAPRGRRHEPGEPRGPPAPDPDAGLPR